MEKKKIVRTFLIRKTMQICHFTQRMNKKKVIFKSFDNQYSCNPRAISEKLYELYPNIDIVWIFKDPDSVSKDVPQYIRKIKDHSLSKLYELATAKVWVDNCTKVSSIWKGNDQYYIQTWHGDKAFKKIGYSAGRLPEDFDKAPVFDLAIAGSEYGKKKYRKAFNYKGEVMNVGTPRNDILIFPNAERILHIRKLLNIDVNTKILLYAPTGRDDNKGGLPQSFAGMDLKSTIDLLQKKTGFRWICLLRAHHTVQKGFANQEGEKQFLDVSGFDDMADLMLIADMMITDYSSCAGDFVLTDKPLILYHGDIADYQKNSRTFYFKVEDSPYFIAKTQGELEELISNMTIESVKKNCQEVLEFYHSTETGHSAEAVAERIISKLEE